MKSHERGLSGGGPEYLVTQQKEENNYDTDMTSAHHIKLNSAAKWKQKRSGLHKTEASTTFPLSFCHCLSDTGPLQLFPLSIQPSEAPTPPSLSPQSRVGQWSISTATARRASKASRTHARTHHHTNAALRAFQIHIDTQKLKAPGIM